MKVLMIGAALLLVSGCAPLLIGGAIGVGVATHNNNRVEQRCANYYQPGTPAWAYCLENGGR